MKVTTAHRVAAIVACVGMMLPSSVLGAPAAAPAAKVSDVALRDGGLLLGQVVDAQAKPLAKTDVSIRLGGKEVARTKTDKNGVFAAKGLRGGQYEVVTAGGVVSYRLWAANTAPPVASSAVQIVSGDRVLAGQHFATPGPGPIIGFVQEYPFVAAGAVAAAIAVPVAVADDDDPSS